MNRTPAGPEDKPGTGLSHRTAMVMDFHCHAFPDSLASRTVRGMEALAARLKPHFEGQGQIKAWSDGSIHGLLATLDRAGILRGVVATIATKASQTAKILAWAKTVRQEQPRLTMLPSVHPLDPQAFGWLEAIAQAGFQGIKLHPYYQGFSLASREAHGLLRRATELGLLVLCHAGYDLGYPPDLVLASPAMVLQAYQAIPGLRLVAAHLGGWGDWEEARRLLWGQKIWLDTAYSLGFLTPGVLEELAHVHPAGYLLFGSDSPWTDPAAELDRLGALGLGEKRMKDLCWQAGARLLGLVAP